MDNLNANPALPDPGSPEIVMALTEEYARIAKAINEKGIFKVTQLKIEAYSTRAYQAHFTVSAHDQATQ
jgi:hypothetical protein